MLTIRYKRIGRKKAPVYRIVVMEKQKDPWSNYIEKLGFYDPKTKETVLNEERIKYWISVGAQASNSVHNLLIRNEIIEGDKKKAVRITKNRARKMTEKEEKTKEAKIEKKAPQEEESKKPEAKPVEEGAKDEAPKTANVETQVEDKKPEAKKEEKN
ncbi:30S ribosomal protein S16 [bacterium]|nr:30S ribosomal protein S16 [bacterium]